MTIRLANVEDLGVVAELIVALRQETIWKTVAFTPDVLEIEYGLLIALCQPQHRLWVAEDDGAIIGMCGVEVTTQRFIPTVPYLQEWALWVAPSHRRTGLAGQLWRRACRWGKEVGAHGAVRGRPTARGEQLFFQYWGRLRCVTS